MISLEVLPSVFKIWYGSEPRIFSAPGRVNIIGEHTDYNEGFVLPMAIELRTYVAIAKREDRRIRVKSLVVNDHGEFNLDLRPPAIEKKWLRYIAGVAWTLIDYGVKLSGADLLIDSAVPIGGGLSSSAALEVAAGKALTAIADAPVDDVKLALSGQQGEADFVGAKVGIMDQLTAVLGRKGHALLIDCRSLETRQISLANLNTVMVVCNTKVKHDLASSAYNQRRAECERGVELLRQNLPHIRALRDVTMEDFRKFESELPEPIRRRCRHVIAENERTLRAAEALEKGDSEELGRLMKASHESLRDDYQVSSPELDVMVEKAIHHEACLGARMTGGGFGGCTINVVRNNGIYSFLKSISKEYRDATKIEPDTYVFCGGDGAREEGLEAEG